MIFSDFYAQLEIRCRLAIPAHIDFLTTVFVLNLVFTVRPQDVRRTEMLTREKHRCFECRASNAFGRSTTVVCGTDTSHRQAFYFVRTLCASGQTQRV